MLTDVRFTAEHQPSVVQSSAKGLLQGASNPDLSDSGGHAPDLCLGIPHPEGTVPLLPCLRAPTEAYHFPSPDEKGARVRLLEHPRGDLCPQASGTIQGPNVQVGADALKGSRLLMTWEVGPRPIHRGLAA